MYAATGGNPFYVTELLGLAAVGRAAAVGRERGARARVAARRRVAPAGRARLGRAEPREHVAARRGDAGLDRGGRGAGAPAAARGRVRVRALPARARAARDPVERPDRGAAAAARRDPRGAAGRGRRPGRHRPPRRGRGRRRCRRRVRAGRGAAGGGAGVEPRGVLRTTGAPPTSSTGCPLAEQATVLEELATGARTSSAGSTRPSPRSSARSRSTASSATRRPSAAARASCRASTGSPATAPPRAGAALEAIEILEPLGESVELARAYSGALPARDARRGRRAGARVGRAGARARDPARRRARRARTRSSTSAAPSSSYDDGDRRAARGATPSPTPPGTATRRRARSINLGYTLMCWVRPAEALRYAQQAARLRASEHEVHTSRPTPRRSSPGCGCAPASGTRPSASRAARARAGGITVAQLLAKTVLAELAVRRGDPDAADRLADARRARPTAAGEPQRIVPALELATEWALTHRRADADRAARAGSSPRSGRAAASAAGTRCGWRPGPPSPGSTSRSTSRCRRRTPRWLRRDWRAAADAFGEVGWTYDRALMLSLLDDEESLVEAIEIARGLGAEPLTRRVAGRMRDLGLRVPHGPREATRANPAGLTARQLEVLALAGRRAHERRDRRSARRLAAHRRAPRRRRADEARRGDAPRRRPARLRARTCRARPRRRGMNASPTARTSTWAVSVADGGPSERVAPRARDQRLQ